MATRSRYTNPIENLRAYIMVKGGIQKDERLSDLEWVQDKINAADALAVQIDRSLMSGEMTEESKAKLQQMTKEYKQL